MEGGSVPRVDTWERTETPKVHYLQIGKGTDKHKTTPKY